jgi:Protein of unknown function (DUF3631)
LETAEPEIPTELGGNRTADNWRPLLAVAALVGGEWLEKGKEAAKALDKAKRRAGASNSVKLIWDIKDAFDSLAVDPESVPQSDRLGPIPEHVAARHRKGDRDRDRLRSEDLVSYLNTLAESAWKSWNHGRGIDELGVSQLLKPFNIYSRQHRFGPKNGGVRHRGYKLDQFKDVFLRYPRPSDGWEGADDEGIDESDEG